MTKKGIVFRIVPRSGGGWNVTQDGQTVSNHRKKTTAVQTGCDLAKKKQPSQLVIHNKDGKIQTEHTYMSDPYPPEG